MPLCFAITATLLLVTSLLSKHKKEKQISYKTAIMMGISQGIAVFPGISRSGSTICTGLLCGGEKKQTTEFSFLMSIPIILCSLVFETYESVLLGLPLVDGNVWFVFAAFVVAFVSGIFAIKLMKKLALAGKYYYFSIYLYLLAILCLFVK